MGRNISLWVIWVFLSIPILGVVTNNSSRIVIAQSEQWPNDGWLTSTPEEQGMDAGRLQSMEVFISAQGWNDDVDSILAVYNGYLVYEYYPSTSYDENDTHHIYSCTKSFTSALVGMAIDQGYIESIDTEVLDFFPELTIENLDSDKQAITIRDLLTMTSGLDWHDQTNYYSMEVSSDWVKYVLDRPMVSEPGTTWNYNTGGTHVLAAIINKTTPHGIIPFVESQLFDPLGINEYYWVTDNKGIPIGGTALNLLPRDMAKFGYLYLKNGLWDNEQIISEAWITESTTPSVITEFDQGLGSGYGYLWWTYAWHGVYAARGSYEQYIFVVPSQDLVVVFTGSGSFTVTALLTNYIFPALGYYPMQNPFLIPTVILALVGVSITIIVVYRFRLRH